MLINNAIANYFFHITNKICFPKSLKTHTLFFFASGYQKRPHASSCVLLEYNYQIKGYCWGITNNQPGSYIPARPFDPPTHWDTNIYIYICVYVCACACVTRFARSLICTTLQYTDFTTTR